MPNNIARLITASLLALFTTLVPGQATASSLELQPVSDNVYAVVGPLTNRTPENLGNNATFGFVVTSAGVVLIDAGGSYKGAATIHALIRSVTDKPIRVVINTGGQDHRWLGNSYFKRLGARIIANRRAVADQRNRVQDQFFVLGNLVGEQGLEGTEAVYADETFDKTMTFTLGDTVFELHHAGHAHTPGDSFVWLPREKIVFSGDIVYVERMLGVMDHSQSRTWVEAFEALAALKPEQVVPGHGHATTLERARTDSYDYLVFLRKALAGFMESGGSITDIGRIDQSSFSHLDNYETLKGRNAQRVYAEMEWE